MTAVDALWWKTLVSRRKAMTIRFVPMLTACCTLLAFGAALPNGWSNTAYGQGAVYQSSMLPTPPAPPSFRRSGVFVGPGAEARRQAEENRRLEEEHRYLIEMHEHQQQMQQRVEALERLQRERDVRETHRQFQELREQREQRLRKQREFQQQHGINPFQPASAGSANIASDWPDHPVEVRRQNQQLVREARAQGRRLTPAEQAEARQRYADAIRAYKNR
jgi:TolA-binding protein